VAACAGGSKPDKLISRNSGVAFELPKQGEALCGE
jgi:hypothetical protein